MASEEEKPVEYPQVPLIDLQSQNPMIEICFDGKDHVVLFVKDILRIETSTEFKSMAYVHKICAIYRDGKFTMWTWSKIEERDIGYEKLMNILRACYPVLKL